MIYEQMPIRLRADLISHPPVAPIDGNTGRVIEFWRGSDVAIQFAIFDAYGVCVDLSNVAALQLLISRSQTDLVPQATKTVGVLDITPRISDEDWQNGFSQQAEFLLNGSDTDLNLGGTDSAQYFLTIRALTASGAIINYVGGYITVFNPGPQLPILMPGIVSYNEQVAVPSSNVTVIPTSLLHKEKVTVNGPARSFAIIVANSGVIPGAETTILLEFPDLTPDIVITVKGGSVTGPIVFNAFTTDGIEPNAVYKMTLKTDYSFEPLDFVSPASLI